MKSYKFLSFLVLAFFCFTFAVGALDIPEPTGHVVDLAGILTPEQKAAMEDRLVKLRSATSIEIAVLTIPSLEGEVLETYGERVFMSWGVGNKETDNGLLILVAKNDRKMRLEVGYGLEGVLPDGLCGRIIREDMAPYFKKGDYNGGINAALVRVMQASKGEYTVETPSTASSGSEEGTIDPRLILFGVVALVGFLVAGFGGIAHRVLGGMLFAAIVFLGGWWIYSIAWGIGLAIPAFLLGLVAKDIIEALSESSGSSGGGYYSSSSSSWSSGGGSSFGGFGGGSCGGGGASGSW